MRKHTRNISGVFNNNACAATHDIAIWSASTSLQWRSQPKNLGGGEVYDFRRITLFCLEKRPSKHKMTVFSEHLGGAWPLSPPPLGYAYASLHSNTQRYQVSRLAC